jgi:hypothetical protein
LIRIASFAFTTLVALGFCSTGFTQTRTYDEWLNAQHKKDPLYAKWKKESTSGSTTNSGPAAKGETSQAPAQSSAVTGAGGNAAKTPPKYTFLYHAQNDLSPCAGLVFSLRRDLNELGVTGDCPQPFDAGGVKGALFSFGSDAVAHNETWTAQGLAAITYSTNPKLFYPSNPANAPGYSLEGLTFGPYFSTNTILNTAKSKLKSNTQVYNYGGLAGITFAPAYGIGLYNNFVFSVAGTSNDLTNVSSLDEMIQYAPVLAPYFWNVNPIGSFPIAWQFDPSLILQMDQAEERNKVNRLAFNNRYDSVRVGPQAMLKLTPYEFQPSDNLLDLGRLSLSLSYFWAYETIGDKSLPLFNASLDYKLDKDDHFEFTATYQRGYDQTTGIYMNQYLLGLSGKM